jgi:hypothetical protein
MTDSTQSSTPADDLNEGGARILTNEDGIEIFAAIEDAQRATDQMTIATTKAEQAAQEESEDTPAQLLNTVQILQDALLIATQKLQQYFPPEQVEQITKSIESRKEYIGGLTPYLEKELEQLHTDNPETAAITLEDIANSFDLAGCFEESDLEQLYSEYQEDPTILDGDPVLKYVELVFGAVRRAKAKYTAERGKKRSTRLPIIKAKRLTAVNYPIDKVNNTLWSGLLKRGKVEPLKAESDADAKKGKSATIKVLLDFDELDGVKISRKLNNYDKRVFIAAANLKQQGQDYVTTAQIYRAMGGRKNPSAADREKILKSLEFMSMGRVFIDNRNEVKLYKKYDRISESFPLLATAIGKGYVNGAVVDDAIHIIEPPRLMTFAENRGQIAPASITLLESPISMTEANLTLEDYLFTRIARMRNNPSITRTISIKTVHEKCNIETRMQKSRLPEKLERILEHYKSEKWIKDYTITDTNIEIETYKK